MTTRALTAEDVQEIRETLAKELGNDLTKTVEDIVRAKGLTLPKGRLPMGGITTAEGADLNGKFKRFGEFLQVVYRANNKGIEDARLKSLQEQAGDTGGFLVPEQFRAELMNDVLENAFVRPRARVIPITGPTSIPRVDVTTHAASVFGGVVAYWRKEGSTLSNDATQPRFGSVRFEPKDLIGYTQVSNQLLMDSAVPLESVLRFMFGEAITFYEEESYINGDGAGEPLGIVNSPALVTVGAEVGQAAATVISENLDNMYSRMLPRSISRAVWLIHPNVFPQLASLSRVVGVGGAPVFITNIAADAPVTLYGRPVIVTEHCQTLGTTGDIIFADLSYYVIGDRQTLAVSSSEHVRFAQNETVWRFIQRLDGQPWLNSAITPKHGTTTLSPFVALAAR